MRVLLAGAIALAAIVTAAAAGWGGAGRARVTEVSVAPWREGPGPLVAAAGGAVPLAEIAASGPGRLPANPPQPCGFGAVVRVTLDEGRTFVYGPCARPPAIERLRLALVRAAEERTPRRGPAEPATAAGWKAVLQDWYDGGRMDEWHPCAAVREAMRHLPDDGPIFSTVWIDLRAYARAVCPL